VPQAVTRADRTDEKIVPSMFAKTEFLPSHRHIDPEHEAAQRDPKKRRGERTEHRNDHSHEQERTTPNHREQE